MGKAIRASLLALLLCSVARAGYIPNFSPTPPAPSVTRAGYIPNESPTAPLQTTTEDEIQDALPGTVTQTALELLAVLPSLL